MRFFESKERLVTCVQRHEVLVQHAQYCLCCKHVVHTVTIALRGLSTSKYVLREHLMCSSEIKRLNLPVFRTRAA
jgi:predicted rRNA methylase YqxC with S4 and FtsJ domains